MPANPGFDSKRPIRSAASLPRPAAATLGLARVRVSQFAIRLRGVAYDRVAELPGVPSVLVGQCCRLLMGNPRWIWRIWIISPLCPECLSAPKGDSRKISRWRILLQRIGAVRATLRCPRNSRGLRADCIRRIYFGRRHFVEAHHGTTAQRNILLCVTIP